MRFHDILLDDIQACCRESPSKGCSSPRYSSWNCYQSPNAEQFPGRTVTSKPLDGSTASSRAKQNRPGATRTGKSLLVEKNVSQSISLNASSSSGASLKTSERKAISVKPSEAAPTNDAKSSIDANEASPVVKPETPTLESESVSTSASTIPSSSSDAKSSVRYASVSGRKSRLLTRTQGTSAPTTTSTINRRWSNTYF
jgi:hypothetical protein